MVVLNKSINYILTSLCLLVGAACSLQARPLPAGVRAFYDPYPYIIVLDEGDSLVLDNEMFFDRAASVVFPVSQTRLPAHDKLLDELSRVIIPQMNSDSLQLLRLVIRGAASPEGRVEYNNYLGRERMKALYDFFLQHAAFPPAEDVQNVSYDIEDYQSLCLMMKRAGDPDYGLVQQLVDRYLPMGLPLLKQMLRRERQGSLWNRLYKAYFPQLRAARIMLVLRKVPAPVAQEVPQDIDAVAVADSVPTAVIATPADTVAPVLLPTPADDQQRLPRREMLSVKTNLLFYGAYIPGYDRWCPIPNVAIEYYPLRGHFTYGASFDMPWWQDYDAHKYFQLRNYQIETRYYLRGAREWAGDEAYHAPAYSGLYLQAYAHMGLFGICFDADRGWVGEGAGGGIGAGYVVPISRNGHWRLELGLQAGFFRCKYDPYQYENPVNPAYRDHLYYYKWTQKPELFHKRQYRWNWLGPTRIGITLTYDLLYYKNKKAYKAHQPQERRTDL